MTERKYECYSEFWKYGIPQEMSGEVMTLREWLIKMNAYEIHFEDASDKSVIDYIYYEFGKRLEWDR